MVKKKLSAAKTRVVCLGLIAWLIMSVSSVSLADTFVAYGPENYIRAKGKPTGVATRFTAAITDTDIDYMLRINNGGQSGEFKKVSSAVIALNGVEIAGTSEFNQNVTVIEKAVTLAADNELVVELRGKPGGGLTIQIEGTSVSPNVKIVRPSGGTLDFPNGVILVIPPGAVTEAGPIRIKDLLIDEIDAILALQENAFHKKRCVGGFSVEPDVVFNFPIKAIVPILPLEPNEIPLLMEIDFNELKYWITKTKLTVLADQQVAEIVIPHFSDVIIGALAGIDDKILDELCTDPLFNQILQICEDLDPLQPAACLLLKEDRPPGTICCKEESYTAKTEAIDFSLSKSSGECEILLDDVEVTYHECYLPNGDKALPQTHSVGEISPNCPEGMTFEIDVQPSLLNMFICEEEELTATITGKTADGTALFEDVEFPPIWEAETPDIVDISPDGTVKGISEGNTQVKALASEDSQIPPGEAEVNVESNFLSFSVNPVSLEVDEEKPLKVNIIDKDGNPLDASDVDWSWKDSTQSVAELQTQQASVIGKNKGTAEIVAAYKINDDCEEKAEADITVECREVTFTVDPPSPVTIPLYDGITLTAKVVHNETGDDLDTSGVTWSSNDPSTAYVTNVTGPWTSVVGISRGPVQITATYDDDCQIIQETGLIYVGCPEVTFQINPPQDPLSVGEDFLLWAEVLDKDGNPLPLDASAVTWTLGGTDPTAVELSQNTGESTLITAKHPGQVQITATYDDGCQTLQGIAVIEVGGQYRMTWTYSWEIYNEYYYVNYYDPVFNVLRSEHWWENEQSKSWSGTALFGENGELLELSTSGSLTLFVEWRDRYLCSETNQWADLSTKTTESEISATEMWREPILRFGLEDGKLYVKDPFTYSYNYLLGTGTVTYSTKRFYCPSGGYSEERTNSITQIGILYSQFGFKFTGDIMADDETETTFSKHYEGTFIEDPYNPPLIGELTTAIIWDIKIELVSDAQ
jgi:hypothetical protein